VAGSEVYRVEIPIIVDDQTDAPLKQAERKISKFEKSAQKETERIRKHFQHIAKYQIEPVMKVRDQLTANVLKADKLISKLDMAQASPLIAAQDRVSAVVTRINAMLDALDKGKVDVAAEMKGPLLDEIIKAKKSLSELNNVKAGPIAELRGQLFGQLTKAMSQIRRLDLTRAEPQVTLRERVTMKIKEIGSGLRSLTARAWNITLQVKDRVTGFFGRIGQMLRTPLGMIGMGGLALSPMALIGNAIKTASEFEQAMANVQSVTGATREEMDRLREAAAKAGRETVFKASEAADALYYLALAGFTVDQQIGALSGTLALAAATQSDLAFTSETIASTISAFGLEAEEADRVANVFAATIGSSQASMDKLATSMRYAGPAAAGFGRSLEETAATLALFYNMGLTGEMAGTRFRTALSALAHPTGDTKKALAELGIEASQVNPAMHSLADIIDLLKDKGVDTAMAMRIFGQETGPAMASLIALGGNALRDMERQITGTNKALEMQEIQLDTLVGAQKELESVWEAVNITLGTQSIPGLRRLVEWFKQAIGNSEELAKSIGDKLNRAFEWLVDILESPEFEEATFAEKIKILFTAAIDEISAWLGSSGKEQLSKVFVNLGEASVKAYISGMKALGQRAIQELKQGNVAGAAVPAAAMWLLGGGALARGAWGLGKGAFGVGKWALGKLGAGSASAAATQTAASAAGTATAAGATLPLLTIGGTLAGLAGVAAGAYDIYQGYKETDYEEARERYWAGGTKIGMVGTGAAIGTAIAPGIGTAVGAGIGGIAAILGGTAVGETLHDVWNDFLSRGSEAWDTVSTWASNTWDDITTWASGTWENVTTWASGTWEEVRKSASSTWDWIKENFTLESIAEKAGYAVGYLESTLFSSEWWLGKWDEVKNWADEKWASMVEVYESAKATIMSTIFNSEWWQSHWQSVKDWTSEKWTGMVEIWENTKEALNSTLFSSEWWLEKWDNVKSWTSEKWDKMKTVWETVKSNISSTLFSKTWWESKWENVKTWASGVLDNITARWESIKESFQAGREAGQRAAATKYAIGGILTRPHLGIVAEAGPEAIIPLSARMRARAMDLWLETGRRLGVRPYAEGGFAGALTQNREHKIPVSFTPSLALAGPATINLNFDLTGLVRQVVIEKREDIDGAVDKITDAIANNLREVFQNMTK